MTRGLMAAFVLAALGAASCRGPEPSPTPAQTVAPPASNAAAGQPSGPQWPNAGSINGAARSALAPQARDSLQNSPVPVLIPNDPGILAAPTQTTVDDNKYTFTSRLPEATVSVQAAVAPTPGTGRRMQRLPRTNVAGREVFLTESEGIRVATWKENGVSYSAEIECAKASDVRCSDDRYLLSMIEKLAFVGGRGARVQ